MADVLLFGDSIRSAELRHEVPVPIVDELVYAERDGRRVVVLPSMEISRTRAATNGALELLPFERFGWDEIVRSSAGIQEALTELTARLCAELGIVVAHVPAAFPLGVADALRARGLDLVVDGEEFERRRRVKSLPELAGIRRAQAAADAAFAAVAAALRAAEEGEGGLRLDGEPLTCERLRRRAEDVLADHDASGDGLVILSHGAQTADGHDPGSGQIKPREAVLVDIFPRDRESGCYADSTRTWCVGDVPAELAEHHGLCMEALDRVLPEVRPGASGRDLHRLACEVFDEAGHPTQLSKQADDVLLDGFYHSLGHGVGLEVHEPPWLGRVGGPLVAGDVVAIEPGCYRVGFGGCRIEDLVLVTDHGAETLTRVPYALAL